VFSRETTAELTLKKEQERGERNRERREREREKRERSLLQ